jgi:hypothetical protein
LEKTRNIRQDLLKGVDSEQWVVHGEIITNY